MVVSFTRVLALTICLLAFWASGVSAQGSGWQYLANAGLPSPGRFEDVYFTDTNTGYAVAVYSSIYKTTDGGNTWLNTLPSGSIPQWRSIEFLGDKTTGIAGSLNGYIYRTDDAGGTWTDITASIIDTLSDSIPAGGKKVCGIAHYGNTFYCVGWWGSKIGHLYKSTDKGITWSTSYIDTNLASSLVDAVFFSADTGFITGGKNIAAGVGSWWASSDESVILKTTDGGITWTKVFSDTTIGGRIWKIQMLDRQNIVGSIEAYYYPDSANMIRSVDGGNTWTVIHVGRASNTIGGTNGVTQGVGFATKKTGWVGGYYSGIFQTTDGGATWDTLQFGTTFNRIFVVDSAHVFAGGEVVYKWTPLPDTTSHVSIKQLAKPPHNLYRVSPNPAKGVVKIEFDINTETNVLLQVANVDMRKHIPITNGRFKPGHYTYYWDSKSMPPGNYIVWLGTDEIPLVQKFVLEK